MRRLKNTVLFNVFLIFSEGPFFIFTRIKPAGCERVISGSCLVNITEHEDIGIYISELYPDTGTLYRYYLYELPAVGGGKG